jgi:hypothetical protein
MEQHIINTQDYKETLKLVEEFRYTLKQKPKEQPLPKRRTKGKRK